MSEAFPSFLDQVAEIPPSQDPGRSRQWLDDLAAADGNPAAGYLDDPVVRPLLSCIFGNSPYLTRAFMKEAAWAKGFFAKPLPESFDAIIAGMESHALSDESHDDLMRALRIAKRRAALLIAFADISGAWQGPAVTRAITDFADSAVSVSIRRLLLDAARKGDLVLADLEDPDRDCGLALIAMGKHGAFELNYSSDIDFVIYYDPDKVDYRGRKSAQQCFIRMTMNLVKILQEVTADGYVLRTDLRLRPDPGVTPVVISMTAAESYYESMGQNWERAAMIKARAFAGDIAAGEAFLERLSPFIWRRNLDFAAIEDVHSIKRQIHDHKGHKEIAVAGHNIKVGRGGIRDIEFFVQTQQLIAGGRDPALRQRGTIEAMMALRDKGWIDADVAAEMERAYHHHRRIEHRLQMINDEQTHSIGRTDDDVDHLARFLGFHRTEEFVARLLGQLNIVQDHYRALFENEESLADSGNLVFTGTEDDPDTLVSLAGMGYGDPAAASGLVRGWHHGRYRAVKSSRSREILTKLVPRLLDAFAATANPNTALNRFDRFLAGLPAGVQLFSLLQAHPNLLDMLAEIIGNAPKLADYLSRNAPVLDAVLGGDFWDPLPPVEEMRLNLAAGLRLARDFEEALDIARRFVKERKFQMGVQMLSGVSDADRNGRGLADLAEAAIAELLPLVEHDFAGRERRGRVAGGRMVVLAMGKFGSYEMTETSDLDLVFIYDYDDAAAQSDGDRALAPSQYFNRLSQRLLNALTAATSEGVMYEVDMRLRPSGNKGPAATRYTGFIEYHEKEAWTWEHMALTRARVVAGDPSLGEQVAQTIVQVLTAKVDPDQLVEDALTMRQRIIKDRGTEDPWELKQVRGGLVDQEFIGQVLQLKHANRHPHILVQNNRAAFANLVAADLLEAADGQSLIDASMLVSTLSALLRVAIDGRFDPAEVPEGLRRVLCRATGSDSFDAVQAKLTAAEDDVFRLFQKYLG